MPITSRFVRVLAGVLLAGLLMAAAGCSKTAEPDKTAAPAGAGAPAPGPSGLVRGHESTTGSAPQGLPEGHPPITAAPSVNPPPEGSGTGATGLSWSAPAAWTEETPSNATRRGQFRVPLEAGDPEDGQCVVFYFGPGAGGTPESNASRWVDQFTQADGSSSQGKAKIEMRTLGGHEVLFVEVKGTYNASVMSGPMAAAGPKPGFALLGAIVPGPDAPWFFKFTGPEKTVEANRDEFEALIGSVKVGA